MNNDFKFVGRLQKVKDNGKFKAYNRRDIQGRWTAKDYNFNIICGDNRHSLKATSFMDNNIDNITIYTLGVKNEKGEYPTLRIPYSAREKKVKDVAEFKKYIIDTELPSVRNELSKLTEKFKNGTVTEEEKAKYDVNNIDELNVLIEESLAKRKEFIHEDDFLIEIAEMMEDEEIPKMKFEVKGIYDFSEYNGKYYTNYIPTTIVRVEDNADVLSEVAFDIFFNDKSLKEETNIETNTTKNYIDGWLVQYSKSKKEYISMPFKFYLPNKNTNERLFNAIKRRFEIKSVEDEYRVMGVILNALEGSQTISITEDMLTDEQKEDIELGIVTFEEIKNGQKVKGDFVKEFTFNKIRYGYANGSKKSDYDKKMFETSTDTLETSEEDDVLGIGDLDLSEYIAF